MKLFSTANAIRRLTQIEDYSRKNGKTKRDAKPSRKSERLKKEPVFTSRSSLRSS